MQLQRALALAVLVLALVIAVGHAPLALGISFLFRPPGARPPPSGPPGGGFRSFMAIGVYFLVATILYVLGGILVASGKLLKLTNIGLIILAIIDNLLLIYTRTMPNVFFNRILPWSWTLFPMGTVQVLVCQTILIVLCAILLVKPGTARSSPAHSQTNP